MTEHTGQKQQQQGKRIQSISKHDTHRICSGQVILNLATAVKELLENALDAGATNVEEFMRNCKAELSKLVSVLQAYAMVSPQVNSEFNVMVSPSVFVSRAHAGKAGGGSDLARHQQFVFLNGRPVDLPRVNKALNDSYRSLTSALHGSARPVAVLDLQLPRSLVDVNVVPDKRTVMMQCEQEVVHALEQAVHKLQQGMLIIESRMQNEIGYDLSKQCLLHILMPTVCTKTGLIFHGRHRPKCVLSIAAGADLAGMAMGGPSGSKQPESEEGGPGGSAGTGLPAKPPPAQRLPISRATAAQKAKLAGLDGPSVRGARAGNHAGKEDRSAGRLGAIVDKGLTEEQELRGGSVLEGGDGQGQGPGAAESEGRKRKGERGHGKGDVEEEDVACGGSLELDGSQGSPAAAKRQRQENWLSQQQQQQQQRGAQGAAGPTAMEEDAQEQEQGGYAGGNSCVSAGANAAGSNGAGATEVRPGLPALQSTAAPASPLEGEGEPQQQQQQEQPRDAEQATGSHVSPPAPDRRAHHHLPSKMKAWLMGGKAAAKAAASPRKPSCPPPSPPPSPPQRTATTSKKVTPSRRGAKGDDGGEEEEEEKEEEEEEKEEKEEKEEGKTGQLAQTQATLEPPPSKPLPPPHSSGAQASPAHQPPQPSSHFELRPPAESTGGDSQGQTRALVRSGDAEDKEQDEDMMQGVAEGQGPMQQQQQQQQQQLQQDNDEAVGVGVAGTGGQGDGDGSDGEMPAAAKGAGLQGGDSAAQHTQSHTAPHTPQPPAPQRVSVKCDAAQLWSVTRARAAALSAAAAAAAVGRHDGKGREGVCSHETGGGTEAHGTSSSAATPATAVGAASAEGATETALGAAPTAATEAAIGAAPTAATEAATGAAPTAATEAATGAATNAAATKAATGAATSAAAEAAEPGVAQDPESQQQHRDQGEEAAPPRKRRRPVYSSASLQAASALQPQGAEAEEAAARELERSFDKSDFRALRVIGQFNLGFILARLDRDIFIIDQHAADEKFNFERYQLKKQPLICPRPLNLSVLDEMVVREHLDTFRRSGFDFVEVPARGGATAAAATSAKQQPQQSAGNRGGKAGDGNGSAAAAASGAAGAEGPAPEEEPVGTTLMLSAVPAVKGIMLGPAGVAEAWGQFITLTLFPHEYTPFVYLSLLTQAPTMTGVTLGQADVAEALGQLVTLTLIPQEYTPLVPAVKGVTLGPADVADALGQLVRSDGRAAVGGVIRPARVRAVLASRACRYSIMIGTPLDHRRMRKILDNLAGMVSPWNCPHGRPTMRHVCVLPGGEQA
ncbi:hypothetical protein DUNSADRAFT_6420 [Dunaliella salina]|uniref:Uncharacterized protein n=1 Tax=Dunaliella salina TaxID=3046 RepID=A0ABQ7H6U1_DUNSA|nr:hypothetical protein DUNSADRAFT_6420 [Dunaliella salina]|eukprot:KAF5842570.1 hypothetical protein DUNSADRAFT_6420 [Dunaliella salina]